MTRSATVILVLSALSLSACRAIQPSAEEERPAERTPVQAHENLNSTLWMQTSAEYQAIAQEVYVLARLMLERALEDSTWTASVEQAEGDGYRELPPAVILDVDETVLDNSPYQARLVQENETYDRESWQAWVREEAAEPVPGALDFTRFAEAQGVEVFYLTNRAAEVEAPTRRNLERLGFPLNSSQDVILTQGERPGWEDKHPRRHFVAEDYRILLLVGDNFDDFVAGTETTLAARDSLMAEYEEFWGTRWIVLPNPQYGSWEGALYDFDYSLSPEAILRRKHERLDPGH